MALSAVATELAAKGRSTIRYFNTPTHFLAEFRDPKVEVVALTLEKEKGILSEK